jgi:hypothetical protein
VELRVYSWVVDRNTECGEVQTFKFARQELVCLILLGVCFLRQAKKVASAEGEVKPAVFSVNGLEFEEKVTNCANG